jgi:hypothetical protein
VLQIRKIALQILDMLLNQDCVPPYQECTDCCHETSMNIVYAKYHLGACWTWKCLTEGKYLLILFNKLVQYIEHCFSNFLTNCSSIHLFFSTNFLCSCAVSDISSQTCTREATRFQVTYWTTYNLEMHRGATERRES